MKIFVVPIFFVLILIIELTHPFFKKRKKIPVHVVNNLATGVLSITIAALINRYTGLSILNSNESGSLLNTIFTLIAFDIWMYFWHRMNHEIRFLWAFHKAHHSDIQMDSSTAFRFHPGELIFSTFARIPVFFILGITLNELIIYETLAVCLVIFHHSNIEIPKKIDKMLIPFIVSPNYHRIHHSDIWTETNSNYSSVLTVWDWIFRSRKWRDDAQNIRLGLKLYRKSEWQNLKGILLTPFKKGI